MKRSLLVVLLVVLLLLCNLAWAGDATAKVEITDPNFSVAGVVGLTSAATGACASYRIVNWHDASLHADAGAVLYDELRELDPFVGLSTNIKPISAWTEGAISLDTRWGIGYLFRADELFGYVATSIKF